MAISMQKYNFFLIPQAFASKNIDFLRRFNFICSVPPSLSGVSHYQIALYPVLIRHLASEIYHLRKKHLVFNRIFVGNSPSLMI